MVRPAFALLVVSLLAAACDAPDPAVDNAGRTPTPATAPTSADSPVAGSPAVEVVPVGNPMFAIPAARYPALVGVAASAEGFAPEGWAVEHRASGDLDGDGRPDLVLVLRQHDPANIIRHEGLGVDPLDTNPRILAIALATPGGPFRLAQQNHALIPRATNPVFEDALQEAPKIRNGVISIRLDFFASAGSWTMFNSTARFRYRQGRIELIGHDYVEVRRNSGEMVERSVNFLTRRVSTVSTTIDAEDAVEPVWTALPAGPLLTLRQVGDGLAFDPTEANRSPHRP